MFVAIYLGATALSAVAITTADPCNLYTAPLRVVLHNASPDEMALLVSLFDTGGERVYRSPLRVAAQSELALEGVESRAGAYDLRVQRLTDRTSTAWPVSVGRCYYTAHVWIDATGIAMTQDVG